MKSNDAATQEYLLGLYKLAQGDMEKQASMHDIGAALSIDKAQADAMGQELIIEGLIDLRTLAGGVSLTSQGLELLEVAGLVNAAAQDGFRLGSGVALTEGEQQALENLITGIKKELSLQNCPYADLERIVIDMKTLEVQLLSPVPKTAIVRAILQSLSDSLKQVHCDAAANTLRRAIQ